MTPGIVHQPAGDGNAALDQFSMPCVHVVYFDAEHNIDWFYSRHGFISQFNDFDHRAGGFPAEGKQRAAVVRMILGLFDVHLESITIKLDQRFIVMGMTHNADLKDFAHMILPCWCGDKQSCCFDMLMRINISMYKKNPSPEGCGSTIDLLEKTPADFSSQVGV